MLIPYLTTVRARAFWGNVRLPQLIFLWLAGLNGVAAAVTIGGAPLPPPITLATTVTALLIAIGLGWTASCAANDVYDGTFDAVANPHRPIPRGIFTRAEFLLASRAASAGALAAGLLLGPWAFAMIALALALNIAYNQPPLRLKRYPLVGTFCGALFFQTLTYAGYFAIDRAATPATYPFTSLQILTVITALTLMIPFKDFKDINGDRAGGIVTLPILLGPVWSRIVVLGGVAIAVYAPLAFAGILAPLSVAACTAILLLAATILFASQRGRYGITPRTMLWWMALPAIAYLGLFATLLA